MLTQSFPPGFSSQGSCGREPAAAGVVLPCAFLPRLAKIKLLDLGIQQEHARIQVIDKWVPSTSLLLDAPGVSQPPEGLSWWRTVSLTGSCLEQASPAYLGTSKSLFLRSLGYGWYFLCSG